MEYERSDGVALQDFLTEADKIQTPEVKAWANFALQERNASWNRKDDQAIVIFVIGRGSDVLFAH